MTRTRMTRTRPTLGRALAVSIFLPLALPPATGLAPSRAADAQTPMTAGEFETYATGKTLSYAIGPTVWGSEQYLPDRRVVWAFTGTDCQYGRWFEDAGAICFVYEADPAAKCWHFFRHANGLTARFLDDPADTTLSEVAQTKAPLPCSAPYLGT